MFRVVRRPGEGEVRPGGAALPAPDPAGVAYQHRGLRPVCAPFSGVSIVEVCCKRIVSYVFPVN